MAQQKTPHIIAIRAVNLNSLSLEKKIEINCSTNLLAKRVCDFFNWSHEEIKLHVDSNFSFVIQLSKETYDLWLAEKEFFIRVDGEADHKRVSLRCPSTEYLFNPLSQKTFGNKQNNTVFFSADTRNMSRAPEMIEILSKKTF